MRERENGMIVRISNSAGCQDNPGGREWEDIVIAKSKEREGTG